MTGPLEGPDAVRTSTRLTPLPVVSYIPCLFPGRNAFLARLILLLPCNATGRNGLVRTEVGRIELNGWVGSDLRAIWNLNGTG